MNPRVTVVVRDIASLEEIARVARIDTLKELYLAQSGHPGSSLSAMDMFVALYFSGLVEHDLIANERRHDKVILSAGHAAPGFYSVLALAGYFEREELATLRQLHSRLEGHTKRGIPGVEFSAGSLGQGLNFGTGIALGARIRGRDDMTFVVMSDGEQQEGSTWEGVMFASSQSLENLVAIVDANGNQINGPVVTIHPIMTELVSKYEAFGWQTCEIDGNNMGEVVHALRTAIDTSGPVVIISHTVTGKGVPFMEGDYHWHHGVLSEEQLREALQALGEDPDEPDAMRVGTTSLALEGSAR